MNIFWERINLANLADAEELDEVDKFLSHRDNEANKKDDVVFYLHFGLDIVDPAFVECVKKYLGVEMAVGISAYKILLIFGKCFDEDEMKDNIIKFIEDYLRFCYGTDEALQLNMDFPMSGDI